MYHNHQLRKDFSAAAAASPYQQKIPREQMDLNTYSSYFPGISAESASAALSEEYYYVKMDSLEAVLDTAIRANKPFRAAVRQQHWTLERGTSTFARYIDDVLYQNGLYLSPDLFYRTFDRWNMMLLGAMVVITVVLLRPSSWFLRIRR